MFIAAFEKENIMSQPLFSTAGGTGYLLALNQYWPITGGAVAQVFGSPTFASISSLGALGPTISTNSFLGRVPGTQSVYLVVASNFTKYHVGSTSALTYYQFGGPIISTGASGAPVTVAVNNAAVGSTINSPS